jgi:hypothetical protein
MRKNYLAITHSECSLVEGRLPKKWMEKGREEGGRTILVYFPTFLSRHHSSSLEEGKVVVTGQKEVLA